MNGTVVLMMVLSGLCFLPSCFPRYYILIKINKTWDEALSYCRSNYTDLATVHNEGDLAELNQLIGGELFVWLGLRPDTEAWHWSLENQDYYGEGEAGFRMWAAGEPNGGLRFYNICVAMLSTGEWEDVSCSNSLPFICCKGTTGTQNTSLSYIFVNQPKTWTDAQSYCRAHYTDLASVRNQAENDQMKMMLQNQNTWIGLHRDSWRWSDGSPYTFSNWYQGVTITDTCMNSSFGKWAVRNCTLANYFACYMTPMRKQMVRVVLKKTDSSVDMDKLKEVILQKFNQTLRDQSLHEEVKLGWVEQPDGKIFNKKNTNEAKEEVETCTEKNVE